MRKIIIFIGLLLFSVNVLADPVKKIVYFGDSLTDNGNLHRVLLNAMPKSPPYYQGRFSNGPVWSDVVSGYFYNKYNIASDNFAVGGATAVFRNPFKGNLPYCLEQEVNHYVFQTIFKDRKNVLYVIWIGANDYTGGQNDVEGTTNAVVNKIMGAIDKLMSHGAHQFLVMNLPDLSQAPFAKSSGLADNVHTLSMIHNQKLAQALDALKQSQPGVQVTLFDIASIFEEMQTNVEKYNKKYNKFIKNTSESCWTGGYTLAKAKHNDIENLTAALRKTLLKPTVDSTPTDPKALAEHLLSSPDTAESYRVEQLAAKGGKACEFPDAYAFWDKVHPTRVVHEILGNLIIEKLLAEKITSAS